MIRQRPDYMCVDDVGTEGRLTSALEALYEWLEKLDTKEDAYLMAIVKDKIRQLLHKLNIITDFIIT